ncbi:MULTISPECIES: TIGR00269 family protein [Pseudothermotoga]|jgi:uncharacterized protein (TIGR00269 family)|uniref:Thiamine biosynthesis protein n=1 Tax=Pseudothermotoga lettingae (strain ATCC BAA-301 / DSM 14385 / NBRC 107922 / TMO) TaxID=416591 RepID=A8F4A0_PSELT|nr:MULTISPECIES: TIGR00269 family protein [Pseudothermotoga]ABV32984.1 thiamine biosynthesis protein [Pseudothermotoga lettingae TMO]KUK21971.1 MAG: Thiamine biosynthesis protein [Pseudothermotoga lettingae]MDI3494236.1 tRNA-5-methyluridine54 2-sulfurtransferase [Pseudothermotoga sp.]MDK2883990.1 tRNA-5-methyluridine54 2-sulfurtransferase [Pseudothermotoga sp.]GLI48014.1 arginosuccinate synthase [Pseudothermotoga lettingae TMO]
MKCRKCSKTAVIRLRQHNTAFCEEHFNEYFEKRVERTINEYSMFNKSEKLLVAVSGGKDSSVAWYVLKKLGYTTSGLFIDLGTENNTEIVKKISEKTGEELLIVNGKQYFGGLTVAEISRIVKRPTCSICGLIRRYIMNKVAYEKNFDAVITGHNLDDEVSFLLGNVLNWQVEYIKRQAPVLESNGRLIKKAKPLVWLTEKEIYVYALINRLTFSTERCPFSKNASSLKYKKVLNELEITQPGVKLRFYKEFQKKDLFGSDNEEKARLSECAICGYPTTGKVCSFCRLEEMVKDAMGKQED